MKSIFVTDNDLLGRFVAKDVVNMSSGEVYAEAGDELTEDMLANLPKPVLKILAFYSLIMSILGRICATRWRLTVILAAKMRWLIFIG